MTQKVLLVEDSRTFRRLLEFHLTQQGYKVTIADSRASADEILKQDSDFLCGVVGYSLPDAEEGEIIQDLLEKDIRSIVLISSISDGTRESILSKGGLDYVAKDHPSSVAYLIQAINRLEANKKHTVLVVDDSGLMRKHLRKLLERQNLTVFEAVDGNDGYHKVIDNPEVSLVITDYNMPNMNGVDMVRRLRREFDNDDLSIVGVSANTDKNLIPLFLKSGANDYLSKPFNPEEFNCRVNQILETRDTASKLYKLANQDMLTGLWNRRYFFEHATQQGPVCVATSDIDFFKKINDTYGHDAGDLVLVRVAEIITEVCGCDLVARFGGEEFCIYTDAPLDEFVARLESLRQHIEAAVIHYNEIEIQLTISIGIGYGELPLEQLLKISDERLYDAKHGGRNQIVF